MSDHDRGATAGKRDWRLGKRHPNEWNPFYDMCPYCLNELRRGVPENGICGHEELLDEFSHLRFNAMDHCTEEELIDSQKRYIAKAEGRTP